MLISGKKLVGGVTLGITAYYAGLLWMEAIFKAREEIDEPAFRKLGSLAFVAGASMGFVNYLVLSTTPLSSNNFLVGLAVILPLIICIFIGRLIYSIFTPDEVLEKLTAARMFLMSFFLILV